jgi:hypothetical protein
VKNDLIVYLLAAALIISLLFNVKQYFDRPRDFITPSHIVTDLRIDTARIPPVRIPGKTIRDTIFVDTGSAVITYKEYPFDELYRTTLSIYTPDDSLLGSYKITGRMMTTFRSKPYEDFVGTEITVDPVRIAIPIERSIEYREKSLGLFCKISASLINHFSAGVNIGCDRFEIGIQAIDGLPPLFNAGYRF